MHIYPTVKPHYRALVFDSGVGGLSVVAELSKHLPNLAMDYVSDDTFRPYGEKTAEALSERLPGLLASLEEMLKPDCIIIACNTASTTALDDIREEVRCPVIGVVPAIKPAAKLSRTKTIGVLGTPGTVRRKYVDGLITAFAGDCNVVLRGSVELVDFAERKLSGETIPLHAVKNEIAPLFAGRVGADIDCVVLACTHFPLLKAELQACITQTIKWVDSGAAIAKRVETILRDTPLKQRIIRDNTAFLMGPNARGKRAKAFRSFGFKRTVGLMP